MYCGICVEVCPYDALFWSPEFEYSEFDVRELTHEKERLSDWMSKVLPPPPLEEGAMLPGQPETAVASGGAGPGSAQRPSPPSAGTAAAERPEQAQRPPAAAASAAPTPDAASQSQLQAGETKAAAESASPGTATEERAPEGPTGVEEKAPDTKEPEAVKSDTEAASPVPADERAREERGGATGPKAPDRGEPTKPGAEKEEGSATPTSSEPPAMGPSGGAGSPEEASAGVRRPEGMLGSEDRDEGGADTPATPNVTVPHEAPRPVALERTEDPEQVYKDVLQQQLDKGSSPQVAEARAKVARVKAERGIKRGPTPVATEKRVPSAPTKGQPAEAEPSGAPEATTPQPDPGPVAPTEDES
jgi:hypothetical protein